MKFVFLFSLLVCIYLPQSFGSNTFVSPSANSERTHIAEDEILYIRNRITDHLLDIKFNGQVLVARFDSVIYHHSFGFADFRNNQPVLKNTRFQLASISKPFTSTAILMLQQEGKLNVNDLVSNHIKEFPYKDITIKQLLNHTGGMANYFYFLPQLWKNKDSYPTNEDLLKAFTSRKRSLRFSPGTKFEYSNTGFAFLALIVERVSGKDYSSFVSEKIFSPLLMNDSFVYDPEKGHKITNRAYGFRNNNGFRAFAKDTALDGIVGDKGIFATAADLYKWDQAICQNQLLRHNLWEKAFEHTVLPNDSIVEYGLGWRLQTHLQKRAVHHPGWWAGFRTSFKRFIDYSTTIIVLCNDDKSVANLIAKLQEIVFFKDAELLEQIHLEQRHIEEFSRFLN